MKVRELVEKLQQFNQDAHVALDYDENDDWIESVMNFTEGIISFEVPNTYGWFYSNDDLNDWASDAVGEPVVLLTPNLRGM